jgi:tape measure domain-containing protein
MLADASGGVNERFQRLTYSFGQTAAMGRLNGIELKEMVMAGFNPLMEISKRTGESMESLKDKMAKGLITFQDVTEAYKMATSEGGRFYGMMNRQSQTVTGLESTFHSAKESAAIAVFERASHIIKEFYKDAINATNQLKDFLEIKQSEKLGDTNAEMNVYIELLKNSNIPLSQRKEIIATLNTEYKDYLSSEITDQTNLNELNRIQSDSNKLISEKIELMIRSEKIADALKAKQEAEKEVMDIASINERAKTGEFKFADYWRYVKQGVFGGLQGQSMLSKARSMLRGDEEKNAMDTYLQAQKVYDDLMNGNTNMTDKIRAAKDLWKSDSTGNVDPNLINHPENNPMKMGGGLGEARTINMNFNQPIMQINAQSVDTRDMEDYSEKTVDFLTETIKNISYPHGGM